jgi:hypothetical protein
VEPIGKLGQDEGKATGPRPGDGAVLSGQAGGPDIEGEPANTLQDFRGYAAVANPGYARLRTLRAWLLALAAVLLALFAAAHLFWYR